MTGLTLLPASDPTRLLRYRDGLYAVDLLTAAIVEFGLFDHLRERPGNLAQLCVRFGWHERPADVLMTLCLCNGLVEKDDDGVFFPAAAGLEHLSSQSPWNLAPYFASLRNRPVVADFVKVLRTGRPAQWSGLDEAEDDWHGSMLQDDFARAFTGAMDCRGVYLGKKLADTVSDVLAGARRVLDVGGGSGVYACALVANAPDLQGVVLEQAPVDVIAREKIEERGLSNRVSVATGDMFGDVWPMGCDLHLFSNVMHDWGSERILELLRRSRATLAKGGRVLIHEAFLDPDKRGPLPVAEYSCILVHSTQGRCYAWSEMEGFLSEAGFRSLGYRPTGGDRGVVVAGLVDS
ncbi:MAG TPA: methyltransferase [Bacteroidia bacterium]|nr:methyltransferase [Bacteroidia bacterium]